MLSDLAFVGLVCYDEFGLWLVSLDGARGWVVVWFCCVALALVCCCGVRFCGVVGWWFWFSGLLISWWFWWAWRGFGGLVVLDFLVV